MEKQSPNIFERLAAIQDKLKAPKDQYNSFGKYKYRSAESILEAVKPLLKELNCTLWITDEMVDPLQDYFKAHGITSSLSL